MRINRLTNRLVIAFVLLIYVCMSFIDLTIISPNLYIDSELILKFSYEADSPFNFGSYYGTSLFYALIPESFLQPIILIIGSICLIIFLKDVRTIKGILIAFFLTLSPIVLFLTIPTKETIVLVISIAVFYIFNSKMTEYKKIFFFLIIYLLYAFMVREYYYIISFVFIALIINRKSHISLKLLFATVAVIIFIFLPREIFLETQGQRDLVNASLGFSKDSRTAFFNLVPPDTPWNFICNYIYSAFRLHLPIFFSMTYKEILHIATCSLFIFYSFFYLNNKMNNIRSNDEKVLFSRLIIAHILTLNIFEPDLGSYLRHLSSIFIYLIPLILHFERNYWADLSDAKYIFNPKVKLEPSN